MMNSFLKEARKWLKVKESIVFVFGNESCDLDSAVCAVGLAYYYSKATKLPEYLLTNGERRFLPVMNISRENFPLKTEVVYFMKEHNIDTADLVCRDEVPTDLFPLSRFILVDHHVPNLPVSNKEIIQIIDHRPLDKNNANFSDTCKTRIQEVGSCGTLVADEIFKAESSPENFKDVLRLLRGPIVKDTINFSEAAGRVRPMDIEVNEKIELLLGLSQDERMMLFNALLVAIADVSSLSAYQLLSKDLKIVTNKDKTKFVAIPGFPLLVEEYIEKPDVWQHLERFANEKNCDIVVLMGVKECPAGDVRRDLALIQFHESPHCKQIIDAVSIENADFLQLRKKDVVAPSTVKCQVFEQENIKATRKLILPLVQKVLDAQ